MKKIMIFTVTSGEGHNSMAKALYQKLSANPNNFVKLVDMFKSYGSKGKFKLIDGGYRLACRYLPRTYNRVYRRLERLDPEKRERSAIHSNLAKETPRLLKDIYAEKPDVIIATHSFPATVITNLRKAFPIPATVVSVLFDFTVHPFWETAVGIDYLITPCRELDGTLIAKGFRQRQLKDFGQPVKEAFSESLSKLEARGKLGLRADMFTVLVMRGGGKFGGIGKLLRSLLESRVPLQILLVHGKDKKGAAEAESIVRRYPNSAHTVVNYGFIDFVAAAMSAADCLVGKCGGVSVNEALNKRLPMLIDERLAEQERHNMQYLCSHGAAVQFSPSLTPSDAVEELARSPERLVELLKGIDGIRKPNALTDLCAFSESLENADYSAAPDISRMSNLQISIGIKRARRRMAKEADATV